MISGVRWRLRGGVCAWLCTPLAILPAQDDRSFAISHVTVIDGRDSVPLLDRTGVVNGKGRFLVPGLWDMHVHTTMPAGAEVLSLYLANGVTGVRDMAGDWEQLSRWRQEIARGERTGPRMIVSGPYLEGGDVPI